MIFGKAGGFAASIDLSALDGNNGFRIDGAAAGDQFGFSVAAAGDVNSDGFDDIIVAARGADPNATASGSSYVIFGHATDGQTLVGTGGDDVLHGTLADDSLSGLAGNDTPFGGGGVDTIDGGRGFDTASFADLGVDVTANLVAGTATAGTETSTLMLVPWSDILSPVAWNTVGCNTLLFLLMYSTKPRVPPSNANSSSLPVRKSLSLILTPLFRKDSSRIRLARIS